MYVLCLVDAVNLAVRCSKNGDLPMCEVALGLLTYCSGKQSNKCKFPLRDFKIYAVGNEE